MGSVARFGGLNTKLQAIYGKMLSQDDYENLIALDSVVEVARYLKENTYYSDVLDEVIVEDVHRGDLEHILKTKLIKVMESLIHFTSGPYKDFMKAMFARYEVEDLKLILRAITKGDDPRKIENLFLHSVDYSYLNYDLLTKSKTLNNLRDNLKGSIYQDAFRNLTEEDLSMREFHLEMNLDAIYFGNLIKKTKALSGEDEAILDELIGVNIDLVNLQWVYRAKKYYGLIPEEILNYTLSGGKNFGFSKLKAIVYNEDSRGEIEASLPRKYRELLSEEDIYLERKIYQFLYERFKEFDKNSRLNISKLVAVIHFMEYEIRDIISITEAIRYEVEDIKEFLIRSFD